ncbi:hypothetical protein BGZ93_006377 [Podila epicladia]|nr:hypothetical protein BGZ93_006377 [Podila epicladia]
MPTSTYISNGSTAESVGEGIDRTITPNHEPRVFFFDIDNTLYPKDSGIPDLMREKYLSYRYYIDYGLAIRGLVLHHPDEKVDGALPLEEILHENIPLRDMIKSMNMEKKWLFTNAGKEHAERVVKCLGLEGLFDGLTYCDYNDKAFTCKPDAESFRKAMREAGVVHASNCYFVDDSAANCDKAVDIGWTAVHVADDPIVSNYGHFQIASIMELPKVLPEFWEKTKEAKEN